MSRRSRLYWLSSTKPSCCRGATKRRQAVGSFPFLRRLRVEPLEDRRLLSITVNTLVDEADGSIVDGDISLRDAIAVAASGETIDFSVTGTINLSVGTTNSDRHLTINKSLTINGPGATLLTINAFDPTPTTNDRDGSSVLVIFDGNTSASIDVELVGLTLTGGDIGIGGGVMNLENLAVVSCTITGNSAQLGGGIWHERGDLTVTRSIISDNVAFTGGGIHNHEANATVIDTTISGNSCAGGAGGGIHTNTSSTFINKTRIFGSTISGNTANSGAGVDNQDGLTEILFSTITGNGAGGGVKSFGDLVTPTRVYSSIIAGNTGGDVYWNAGSINPFQSNGYNVIGSGNGASVFVEPGDQTGIANPMLGPLAHNGGPTKTHALLAGSPAIDAGDPAAVAGMGNVPLDDQRGAPFTRVFDGDGAGGVRIDIGAYERQTLSAANFVVDTLTDESDGDYSPGDRSLREAIGLAHDSVGAETITFAASLTSGGPATILLTRGELAVRDALTIDGPGAHHLTIDASGNDPTPATNNGNGSRVFNIDDGNVATNIGVSISGLTLTGGDVAGAGGAVYNSENLTVDSSTITGNAATAGGGGIHNELHNIVPNLSLNGSTVSNNFAVYGGGISGRNANLTILGSTITGNQAASFGGGFHVDLSTLTITNSTISGNNGSFTGGGIFSDGTTTTITSSTISGNSAVDGAGIASNSAETTLTSSTVSGNLASDTGGGVFAISSVLTVNHSTVTGNVATGGGGGLYIITTTPEAITHSIVAGNTRGAGVRDDIYGAVAVRFSLIGDGTGATITNNGGNLIGTSGSPINPLLGLLADNGGLTKTHALLAGSPAIDAGNAAFSPPPTNDQRGAPFTRVFDGDGAGGVRIDIGAYERQTLSAANFVVDTLTDESDGDYSPGDRSLREAIGLAHGSFGAETITFAPSLTSGGPATILLTRGELAVRDALTIDGPGAHHLTIDASGNDPTPNVNNGNGSRVFNIDSGTLAIIDVEIVGLTLTGGDANLSGGAIRNRENLMLVASVVTGNSTTMFGGGLYSYGATSSMTVTGVTVSNNFAVFGGGVFNKRSNLTVTGSKVSGNVASSEGGGISHYYGTLSVANSTISGNNSSLSGGGIATKGGIYASATATVTASTISGNTAQRGGGIWSYYGTLTVASSTISGNSATHHGGGLYLRLGTQTVRHSTVTANQADSDANASGLGGGIFVFATTATLDHSLVAQNLQSVSTVSDISGAASARFSLIGDNTGATITNNGGNLIGTGAMPINPLLGPLADIGGPTITHALLPGSSAIDAGDPAAAAGAGGVPLYDQRGAPFTRVFNGDGLGGARIDIGAFELQAVPPAFYGDYNQNGLVDAADYVVWRDTLGVTGVTAYSGADGDGDTTIDQDDYGVWRAHFGTTVPLPAAGSGATALAFSQPAFEDVGDVAVSARAETTASSVGPKLDVASGVGLAILDARSVPHDSASRPLEWINTSGVAESTADNLLLMLAIDRAERFVRQDFTGSGGGGNDEHPADEMDSQDPINWPLRVALAGWP